MPKGKQINSTSKQIICNVYDYFENESKKCKEVHCIRWGRRHLKLLVTASELLNESLQQNLLHQKSSKRRPDYT